jgi:nitrogen-specific signal transduction histidine kinase/ActR/RegA family two-component response regulator
VIVVRDVTQQRELEDEIAKIERLESVGVLAGGIAHDFNNILSAVLGNISIAKMATDDESMRDDRIAEAERAALRARDLTQQLLTFARGGEPVRKSVDLEAIVREAVTFGLRGSKAGHTIECEPDLWPVEADEGQIGRVINNLVINADQAMPQGGKVTVEVRNIEVGPERNLPLEPGRYVFVRIADEGIGIPDELLQRIFDPFFTTKQRGSGLGLATSFSIVQKHDGHMAVESEVGKGTAFTIYLPVSEKKPTDALQEDEIAFQGRGRVLVMDDEEPVQEVVRVMLEEMGFEVVTVGDGARMLEAYQQARMREEPFDVVIMDLTIPGGMGGEEAIAHLLRLDPDVRAIVASGYSNDPVMAEYRKHGFRGMVAKPFGYDDLVKAMKAVMA